MTSGLGVAVHGEPGVRLRILARRPESLGVLLEQPAAGTQGSVGIQDAVVALFAHAVSAGPPPRRRAFGAGSQCCLVDQLVCCGLAGHLALARPHGGPVPGVGAELDPEMRFSAGREVDVAIDEARRVWTGAAGAERVAFHAEKVDVLGCSREREVIGRKIALAVTDQVMRVHAPQFLCRVVPPATHQVVHEPAIGGHHDAPRAVLAELPARGRGHPGQSRRGTGMPQSFSAAARLPYRSTIQRAQSSSQRWRYGAGSGQPNMRTWPPKSQPAGSQIRS